MISPASETAIRSATLTGIQRERDRRLAGVDQPLELAGAARAADEIDPLVGADVGDLQHRRQQPLLQHADVERRDRIRGVWRRRADAACASRPGSTSRCRRACAGIAGPGVHVEALAHRLAGSRPATARRDPSRCGCRAGSAPGRAETPPPASSTRRRRRRAMRRQLALAHLGARPRRAGRAMMAVGDVQRRNPRETRRPARRDRRRRRATACDARRPAR